MPPNGTYAARLTGPVIIYMAGKDEDALETRAQMGRFNFIVTEGDCDGQSIFADVCFTTKAGVKMERAIQNMQEVFGMPGANVFWLQYVNPDDHADSRERDLTAIECSIVVEGEEYNGKTKQKVKWINKPGFRSGPKPVDRAAFMAIHGSSIKAMESSAKSAPKAPVPGKAPAAPQASASASSQDESWQEFQEQNAKQTKPLQGDALNKSWFAALKKMFGAKDQASMTPQDWGNFKASIDTVPM